MTCCAYSCTQYGLHTVHASDPCWWLDVPTAAHSTVSTHSTCFWPMLMTCSAYSCTQYGLHTHYMLLIRADDLLCLQLHTVRSPYTVHASNPCWWLAVPTAAQYGLHTQYMLLTHAADFLCLQLHTVRSPYTVHASNPCWWLAVPTAAHSTVSTHSTCFWRILMTCCAYSCTQYGLHTQYMLLTHTDDLLCLQPHTVHSPYTVHASNLRWCLAVPTAAHSTVSIHSTCF